MTIAFGAALMVFAQLLSFKTAFTRWGLPGFFAGIVMSAVGGALMAHGMTA